LQIEIPEALTWVKKPSEKQKIEAQESKTVYLNLKAKNATEAVSDFNIQFLAKDYQDAFTKSMTIISRGFPVEEMFSGREKEKDFLLDLNDPIEGSVSAVLSCYPSSSNYPNVLVYDLLESTNNLDQATADRTQEFLDAGYKRLTGFEVPGGGFDWYGRPPGHEALTAYGLLQFTDMSQIYPVSNKMLKRNIKWLLSRKDGNGGWQNSKRALHSWASTSTISDAFIVWALTEAGEDEDIDAEVEKSYKDAMKTKDPYLLALMANTMFERGDQRAQKIMDILLPQQRKDGSWNGLTTSMTHSRGKGLLIETTSLTALAIMKDKVGMPQLQKAIDFISSSKSPYGFGSTQSTVLAMKALVQYAKFTKSEINGGHILVYVNGKEVAKQKYRKGSRDNITIPNLGQYLGSGQNKVTVKFSKEEEGLPYDLTLKYNTRQPNSSEQCPIDLTTELTTQNASVGENIRLNTTITNLKDEAIPNTIAKIGIPAGLSLQAWQLKELQEKGVFDFYEIFDGYVVFHYRGLAGNEEKKIGLDLKADIPGTYEAPASVAYLYYTNEFQKWTKPGEIVIVNN